MVQLVRITGKYLDEPDSDKTLVEVMLDGKSVYAAVCMPFAWYGVPSPEWLTKYAKEIVAWVAFEHGNMAHPVVLGFRPLKDKTPGPDYPRVQVWKSEGFTLTANDKTPKLQLRVIDGVGLFVVPGKVSLGKDSGAQPAVLGNENADRLNDVYGHLDTILTQLGQAATGLTALGVPQGATITAAVTTTKALVAQGKAKVPATKSQDVALT